MTASLDTTEPPADTGGVESYVLCPDAIWYPVFDDHGDGVIDGADDQDFEVAWAYEQWVSGVDGRFCFSWLEFYSWALRTGYEVRLDDGYESGYFGEAVRALSATGLVECDG
ncbi:MAG: hypothetical protein FJ102_21390 [Deltaproteobacteria bacterium]|nr:hypothetical protein [Deltaproteobacteria bacterium]